VRVDAWAFRKTIIVPLPDYEIEVHILVAHQWSDPYSSYNSQRDKPSSNLGEIDPEKIMIYDIDLGEEHYWISPEDDAHISKYVSNLVKKTFIESNEKVNWEWLYTTNNYYY